MMKRLMTLAIAGAISLCLVTAAPAAQGSGCLPTTGIVSGLTMTQKINDFFAAITSVFSGASAPVTDCSGASVKGQMWLDTSVSPNVLKQYDGAVWVTLGALDSSKSIWSPPVGGGSASLSAASTTDICAAPAAVQNVSGTTAITSFGSGCVTGVRKTLIFSSATPITYNSTSLIMPGQRSYTSAAGDVADAIYLGAGNWRILNIAKIDGSSVTNPAIPLGTVIYGDYGTIPAKTVYGSGQALSRSSYPDYLAAVTRVQTGTLTAGNNTITSVGNTSGLGAGMPLEGTGIQAGTTISSVTSSTIVMSATATANGSRSVTTFITGYGTGGDSTTVGVKDCRGRMMAGRDDVNGTPAGRITSAGSGIDGKKLGATGGAETVTLTASQIPTITSSATNTINVSTSNQAHGSKYVFSDSGVTSLNAPSGGGGGQLAGNSGIGAQTVIASGDNFISVTSDNTGGAAHNNMPPAAIAECVVVVLP